MLSGASVATTGRGMNLLADESVDRQIGWRNQNARTGKPAEIVVIEGMGPDGDIQHYRDEEMCTDGRRHLCWRTASVSPTESAPAAVSPKGMLAQRPGRS